MNSSQPTPPAPGASAEAVAAAKEIDREADFAGSIDCRNAIAQISEIITRHFAPLLARVAELEKHVGALFELTNELGFGTSSEPPVSILRKQLAAAKGAVEQLCSDRNVEIAAEAIWKQHMNKLEPIEQTAWENAAPLGRGITLAYAQAALTACAAAGITGKEEV